MRLHVVGLATAFAWVLVPAAAHAEHEAHQAVSPQAPMEMALCAQVQPAVANIIAAATARLESARQSNDPAQMRTAVDHLQGALRDLRTQLAPCAAAGAATDSHAGHSMPPSTNLPAAVADPHAGHKMPPATAAPKEETPKPHAGHDLPATKPSGRLAQPKAQAVPHADHPTAPAKPAPRKRSKPPATDPDAGDAPGTVDKPVGKQMDPVTGLMVDPATAPKTTHQGQTYYFSSEASRKEFLENPAKFARKPKR